MVRAHCRGLDHPVDHPDDPTGPVWIRLDRRPMQREQARADWSRPDRRRAPGYGSGGWGFESLAARTITAAQRPVTGRCLPQGTPDCDQTATTLADTANPPATTCDQPHGPWRLQSQGQHPRGRPLSSEHVDVDWVVEPHQHEFAIGPATACGCATRLGPAGASGFRGMAATAARADCGVAEAFGQQPVGSPSRVGQVTSRHGWAAQRGVRSAVRKGTLRLPVPTASSEAGRNAGSSHLLRARLRPC
jgi:hypothetical protein